MSDLYFPVDLPGLVLESRSTEYGDNIQEAASGPEYRLNRTATPRYRYEYSLRFARGTHSEWQDLQDFFTDHGGRRESFLLVDGIDGTERRARFGDPDLTLERIVPGIYSCSFELVTVGETSSGSALPLDDGGGLY